MQIMNIAALTNLLLAMELADLDFGKIIPIAIALIVVLIILFTGYLKAPPDTAYIISGLRRKIIIGRASIRIPFFERVDKLKLQLRATPQPRQHQIRAASETYTTACGNARPLTH